MQMRVELQLMWKGNSVNHYSNRNHPDSTVPLFYTYIIHASRVQTRRSVQSHLLLRPRYEAAACAANVG